MQDLILEFKEKNTKIAQLSNQTFLNDFADDDFMFDDEFNDDTLTLSFDEEPSSVDTIEHKEEILSHNDGKTDPTIDSSNPMQFRLPGAVNYVKDDSEDKEPPKEEPITNWEDNRDPKHFMVYILQQYPNKIPSHDGKSTLGCERAVLFLNNLNKEISEALRADSDDCLDIATLEKIRVNINKDIVALNEHRKELNKKLKKSKAGEEDTGLVKEAKSGRFQVVVTPFIRAVTGIIINGVVSSGKQFDDIYNFLKEKYKFTDREELEILQVLMDSGFPILKDRGLVNESLDPNGENKNGVEFMKTYFA